MAYRFGFRNGLGVTSRRFDRLWSRLWLDRTEWSVEFTEHHKDGSSKLIRGLLRFQQSGSRVVGEGEDENGHRWSVEGVCFEQTLVYTYLDRRSDGHQLGSVQIDIVPEENCMQGIRTAWSNERQCLIMQPIQFSLVENMIDSPIVMRSVESDADRDTEMPESNGRFEETTEPVSVTLP